MWQFDPLLYSKGARRRNSLPMQYCTLAPIILRWVDNMNFASYTFFDIFIKSNKSFKAMSSLSSTIRKLKIYTRHPPPGLSRDLYGPVWNMCTWRSAWGRERGPTVRRYCGPQKSHQISNHAINNEIQVGYIKLSRCVARRLHASWQRQQRVRHTPKARRRPSA